jgi:hypothetical protein
MGNRSRGKYQDPSSETEPSVPFYYDELKKKHRTSREKFRESDWLASGLEASLSAGRSWVKGGAGALHSIGAPAELVVMIARRTGLTVVERSGQDLAACSRSAITSFFIFIMASMALGCLRSSVIRAGTICQQRPNLSFSQPHWISVPPPARSLDQ